MPLERGVKGVKDPERGSELRSRGLNPSQIQVGKPQKSQALQVKGCGAVRWFENVLNSLCHRKAYHVFNNENNYCINGIFK